MSSWVITLITELLVSLVKFFFSTKEETHAVDSKTDTDLRTRLRNKLRNS